MIPRTDIAKMVMEEMAPPCMLDTEMQEANRVLINACEDLPLPSLEDFMGKERWTEYCKFLNTREEGDEVPAEDRKFRSRQRPLTDAKVVFQENAW